VRLLACELLYARSKVRLEPRQGLPAQPCFLFVIELGSVLSLARSGECRGTGGGVTIEALQVPRSLLTGRKSTSGGYSDSSVIGRSPRGFFECIEADVAFAAFKTLLPAVFAFSLFCEMDLNAEKSRNIHLIRHLRRVIGNFTAALIPFGGPRD